MSYQILDHNTHVLVRPDSYIGCVQTLHQDYYGATLTSKENLTPWAIVSKSGRINSGLHHLFIEILSNAIDNFIRSKDSETPQTKIKVNVTEQGKVSVWNDGRPIPIEINAETNLYNPEMIFGHLLSGSNFDDTKARTTSGRNGVGSTVTNIFSKEFTVRCADGVHYYEQTWTENMTCKTKPIVRKNKMKGFVELSFLPDFQRFGEQNWNEDMKSLLLKDVLDCAMITGIQVFYNDKRVPIKTMKDYAQFYEDTTTSTEGGCEVSVEDMDVDVDNLTLDDDTKEDVVIEEPTSGGKRIVKAKAKQESVLIEVWGSTVVLTPNAKKHGRQISFVNSQQTPQGGCHVDAWMEAFLRPVLEKLNQGKTTRTLTLRDVKPYFNIYLVCTIENPQFTSQDKVKMYAPPPPAIVVEQKHINAICKFSVIDTIKSEFEPLPYDSLKKAENKNKSFRKIEKYDRANLSGSKKSQDCYLLLTEGDSAKTFVISGMTSGLYGKKGRDYIGVFALKGVVMNVMCDKKKEIKNKELVNLIQILNLKQGLDYTKEENFKTLNYGHVVLLTDADCFTNDTPILIRVDNRIEITSMESLYNEWCESSDIEIWSEQGWTKVKCVQRKESTKKILRIGTNCGFITCTEDHKMLLKSKKEITANKLKYREDRLLRVEQDQYKDIPEGNDPITEDEAWLYGLFFALGTQYENGWSITDIVNRTYIDKAVCIHKKIFQDCQVKINYHSGDFFKRQGYNPDDLYTLVSEDTTLVHKFYDPEGNKVVPSEILNAPKAIQQTFIEGANCKFYTPYIDNSSQVGSRGFCYVAERVGYHTIIHYDINDRHQGYRIFFKKGKNPIRGNVVSYIQEVEYTHPYVYDIETENHHLNAGVGDLVVHNCDGIHIGALITNFFHCVYPTLLQREKSFLLYMRTPILRMTLPRNQILDFYNIQDYNRYCSNPSNRQGSIKYYKGLGTSSKEASKELFGKKMVEFVCDDQTDQVMHKVFDKKRAGERKEWIQAFDPSIEVQLISDEPVQQLSISDFLNKELIHFSIADNRRSIPSVVDGLKESQRKILYGAFLKKLTKECKVAQLSGYIGEHTGYHHGEVSLQETIIKMAQDFICSNNIPYFTRGGQFGSLNQLGDDSASARYIYTALEKITPMIYSPLDDHVLTQLNDDGDLIEWEYFVPVLPMILVNGAKGIGTGFSTEVCLYNPLELIHLIELWLEPSKKTEYELGCNDLVPWYRGFKGTIVREGTNKFITTGVCVRKESTVVITCLPIGVSIESLKDHLDTLLEAKKIKSYKNYSSENTVHFDINTLDTLALGSENDLTLFKMTSTLSSSNMTMFDSKGLIKKYTSIQEILDEYCTVRYAYYEKRRLYQMDQCQKDIDLLTSKRRFLGEVLSKQLVLDQMSDEGLTCLLLTKGYRKEDISSLLDMNIRSFTRSKLEKLDGDIQNLTRLRSELSESTPTSLWKQELENISKELK